MSATFAFDIKSPADYSSHSKIKLDHEARTWKKWQQFMRDLKEDYPDESKVSWFSIMQSVSDFRDYTHKIRLSANKEDPYKIPRLRFGCLVYYPVPPQAVGIMKDLGERAAKYFNVETFLYNAPGVLAPEVLDALALTMKDELQDTVPKDEKQPAMVDDVAENTEEQSLANKQAKTMEFAWLAFLIPMTCGFIFNKYKLGVEPKTETIPTIVLCLVAIGVLTYRQVY